MISRVHFSSADNTWKTPKDVLAILDSEFHFDFDPCPTKPSFDGLTVDWKASNFVNPPYDQLYKWTKKSFEESQKGKTVVMLIPSRTDTKAFHEFCLKAKEIRFIKGRLCFSDSGKRAPFPSMIVVFNEKDRSFRRISSFRT